MMVCVERADEGDLERFAAMEREPGIREFIVPHEPEDHSSLFSTPGVVYLRILSDRALVGYFILVLEPDGEGVEFRRIVVASRDRGIGQAAIAEMEDYCRNCLNRTRIWLDVFEHNARGRHVYEKLGYELFDRGTLDGRPLLLYRKPLQGGEVT